MKLLIVGLGGALGAILRYLVAGLLSRAFPLFPWGTFVVNVSGSFLLGFSATLMTERLLVSPETRIFITIGLLGAYTTFSTFEYESLSLLENGAHMEAFGNIFGSLVAGLVAVKIGRILAQIL
ncbi:fluoride efflux transporter CrcB [Thermosulfuriphilus ammonigenes]|uniref:Fluoride-specific ion channel FluC n=1 Tax=Thermosulfuriphilus ammonigenes TaxID=1936021 RepID=A0A6G7PVC0_9BACT|nr:fluoride efflux transporter CrcB [Thermosulfuriphilus ammonigenes]MBA2848336.1 CrcB protein [Thermosulfuriphilus ammonigenes]QIJ71506.1 fluoride efflux transporter CrcB [Thermosulfuriphilus ammonigenes]